MSFLRTTRNAVVFCLTGLSFLLPVSAESTAMDRLKQLDQDKDGKLTEKEIGGKRWQRFGRFDTNKDQALSVAEVKAAIEIEKGKPSTPAQEPQARKSKRPGGVDHTFVVKSFTGSNDQAISYSFYTPAKIGRKVPLVVCLHGRGGSTHAGNIAASGKMQSKNPCFVLAPRCNANSVKWFEREGSRSAVPELIEAIDDLVKTHPIDPNRIYVTGQSMGGIGTWSIITAAPDEFAAAVPVCGSWRIADVPKVKHIPIWAFHGDKDKTVLPEGSRKMVKALKAAGASPKYTEYPGVGHNSWTQAYATDELWSWMFQQSKG